MHSAFKFRVRETKQYGNTSQLPQLAILDLTFAVGEGIPFPFILAYEVLPNVFFLTLSWHDLVIARCICVASRMERPRTRIVLKSEAVR